MCTHTHMTLCDPMNYSPPGSSVHGILLARILEWVTISSPRESSDLQIKLSSLIFPALAGGFFTTTTTWEAQMCVCVYVCVCMCVCIYMCVCGYVCVYIYMHAHLYIHIYIICIFFHFTVYQECFPFAPFFLATAQHSLVFTSVSINTHPLLTSIGLLLTLNNYHLSYLLVIVPQQHSYPYKQGFPVASPICASWLWFAVTGGIP